MILFQKPRIGLAFLLVLLTICGVVVVVRSAGSAGKTHVIAYFDSSDGIFPGDQVRILGVPVGEIDSIEPQPERVKISFWFDDEYNVPADARAVILSPSMVTARAIQLTPSYAGGPAMTNNTVIPQRRTAVPMEWDDLRQQLQKLTESLQPTQPGGVSTLGAFIDTAADNLRGQGLNTRDTILKLSQAFSALGDHSGDIFSTVNNLSILVSALEDSAALTGQLNHNLAAVTGLLANDSGEVAQAIDNLNTAVRDVKVFVAANRESLTTTSDRLASVTTAVHDSIDDIEQALHITPTTFADFLNTYEPAQGAFTAALAVANFADPISFICGAIQAASRLQAEQSAKLCVQYLAPIVKNRQYNFPPLGLNPFVGAKARPNEVTYSEDWMRPDYIPPQVVSPSTPTAERLPAEEAVPTTPRATDPAAGLPGMMVPHGGGA